MQIFEFHFNPKLKPDLIFDSFCYEPENIYERKMGSLYMLGFLKSVLPKNLQFLEKVQKVIKERYYKGTIFTPEKSLKESLREANEFLEKEAKKGDVSWLGNLSFAVLSLKNFKLNFTKVGEIKFFLLRGKRLIDIDKKLRLEDIEPYPLKIFGNIVSGKLAEGDVILVLTKEISDFFQKENLIDEIIKLPSFSENGLKEILDQKKESLAKISGILLAVLLTKESGIKKEAISPQISKEFSLKEVFTPLLKSFLRIPQKIKKPEIKIPKLFGPAHLPRPQFIEWVTRQKVERTPLLYNKKSILILVLIFVLFFGFIVSQYEKSQRIKIYQENLKKIEENLNLVESYLILQTPQAVQKANSLLKESFEKNSQLLKETRDLPKDLSIQILSLHEEILNKLYSLNKLEEIKTPQLFFEFKPAEFIPQKFLIFANNLYFFSPYSENLFLLTEKKESEIITVAQKINLANAFDDSILFFSKPSQILPIKEGKPNQLIILKEPYPDFSFDDFSSFRGNLYFFDKKAGQIIKYPSTRSGQVLFEWGIPEFWLTKSTMGKSIAIDGSIWILEKDNSVGRYYTGNLQEKIELDIFPPIKDFSKIFTSSALPYLYILEPVQKRILVLTKTGELIKQFQSENFDNLLDFSVSPDGKTIWLLNGLKVYQILL